MQLTSKGLVAVWFAPEEADDEGKQAEFKIKPLTQPELLECMAYMDYEQNVLKPKGLYVACRLSMVDWRGITEDDGTATPFSRAAISRLPADALATIGLKIIQDSQLTGDEVKN